MLSDLTDNKTTIPCPFKECESFIQSELFHSIYCRRKVCDSTDRKDDRKVHFASLPHIYILSLNFSAQSEPWINASEHLT